jgi:hypothetical protein
LHGRRPNALPNSYSETEALTCTDYIPVLKAPLFQWSCQVIRGREEKCAFREALRVGGDRWGVFEEVVQTPLGNCSINTHVELPDFLMQICRI